mmetsp:Transcript_26898/g.37887  ORF Transcript_26898/g.37887 Transcript_26898/m.37887 type:complete len:115 (+) Transcript_26898:114-458(+)|eukprot:CAMPEP_0168545986 /NCGR_PEP_ID=MMETSP0413-20121227/3258_1 /TAXON_ID=136452 /ORGANISM="Filamoeba nolandi, Strain NC-AS-23-1" /LENGTH=114 /DNA_ID=CAMNT_0008576135 /DNA_START=114 /DNA_END=461 /DNA_ORIENTATION=-
MTYNKQNVFGAGALLLTAISFLTAIPQSLEDAQCGSESEKDVQVLARLAVIAFLAAAIVVLIAVAVAGWADNDDAKNQDTLKTSVRWLIAAGVVIGVGIILTIVEYAFSLNCLP